MYPKYKNVPRCHRVKHLVGQCPEGISDRILHEFPNLPFNS